MAAEDLLSMLEQVEPYEVLATPVATFYRTTIRDEFKSTLQFENIVNTLEQAQESDLVEIKLVTPGGRIDAILPLLAAMEETKASTYVRAISDVASAGTFVLLKADNVYINPHVSLMFHNVQYAAGGTGSSVEACVNHITKSSKALVLEIYQDFFTDQEIDAMLNGKDFYMGKEEFDERYERRAELREARLHEEQEAMAKKMHEQITKKRGRKKKEAAE